MLKENERVTLYLRCDISGLSLVCVNDVIAYLYENNLPKLALDFNKRTKEAIIELKKEEEKVEN